MHSYTMNKYYFKSVSHCLDSYYFSCVINTLCIMTKKKSKFNFMKNGRVVHYKLEHFENVNKLSILINELSKLIVSR